MSTELKFRIQGERVAEDVTICFSSTEHKTEEQIDILVAALSEVFDQYRPFTVGLLVQKLHCD